MSVTSRAQLRLDGEPRVRLCFLLYRPDGDHRGQRGRSARMRNCRPCMVAVAPIPVTAGPDEASAVICWLPLPPSASTRAGVQAAPAVEVHVTTVCRPG